MAKQQEEAKIQKAITDYLKLKKVICFKHRNVGIYKKATNQYIPLSAGEKGISDIIGCLPDGRFLAIEVKKVGGVASKDQLEFLEKVKKNNGVAILAFSLDDVLNKI